MKQAQGRLCAELSGSSLADPLSPERKATAIFAADLDAWITCVGAVPRAATKAPFLDEAVMRNARTPNQMLAGAAPALSTEALFAACYHLRSAAAPQPCSAAIAIKTVSAPSPKGPMA